MHFCDTEVEFDTMLCCLSSNEPPLNRTLSHEFPSDSQSLITNAYINVRSDVMVASIYISKSAAAAQKKKKTKKKRKKIEKKEMRKMNSRTLNYTFIAI